MKIKDILKNKPEFIPPSMPLVEAAKKMRDWNYGFLPVGENGKFLGTITDRDITIRGVAEDLDLYTPVKNIMTDKVLYCFEDDDLRAATRLMRKEHIRRLLVLNKDKELAGIVSMVDIAQKIKQRFEQETSGELLAALSEHAE